MTNEYDLVIRNALHDRSQGPVNIGIVDGIIKKIDTASLEKGKTEIDVGQRYVIPGFVDLHMHLDKAYMGGPEIWECVTLMDMVKGSHEFRSHGWDQAEITKRALKCTETAIRHGTTALRTHVDLGQDTGLAGIKALLDIQKRVKPWIDIDIIAFTTEGFTNAPDGGEKILREALDLGANLVGGAPLRDPNPGPYMEMLIEVAKEYKVDVDLHIDESNNPDQFHVEEFAEKAIKCGYEGHVIGSHVCSLFWVTQENADRIISKLVKADMKVIANPPTNLYIRGPNPRLPTGPTRVNDLLNAGVPVGIGTDNTGDFFAPLGNADMLHAALLMAYTRRLGGRPVVQTVFDMATTTGASFMGLEPSYGVMEGGKADLVVLDAKNKEEALVDLVPRAYVIKNGQIVVKQNQLVCPL